MPGSWHSAVVTVKLQEATLCTLTSLCAPALGPGSGWLLGRDAEPRNAERAPVHWHVALVKATVGLRSGDFDPSMVLVKLIPSTNSAENKGIKGERAVAGRLSCSPFTFGAQCKDTVPGLGFNPSLPAWWKSWVSVCLPGVGW